MPRVRGVRIGTRFLRYGCSAIGVAVRRRGAAPPAGRGPHRRRPARARSAASSRSRSTTRWPASASASIRRRRARRSARSTSSTRTCSRSATGTSSCSTSFTARRAATSSSASCCSSPGSPTTRRWSRRARATCSRRPSLVVAGGRWRSRELSSVVVLLPVASPVPGRSICCVVTRDVWSLRFNTNFEYQGERADAAPDVAVGEQPVRLAQVPVGAASAATRGRTTTAPTYFDPNIRGTRLTLYASALFYNSRETGRLRGQRRDRVAALPALFAGDASGARGVDVIAPERRLARLPRQQPPAGGPGGDAGRRTLPYEYRRHVPTVDASVVRSFGAARSSSA